MTGVRRRGPHRSQRKTRETAEGQQACAAEGGKAVQATPMPAKRNAGAARSSQGIKPRAEEVMMSIESLYVDELKPFGRILRKRVAERYVQQQHSLAASPLDDLPDVDIKHLKAICDESERLLIEPEEGGDWSAVIQGRVARFVDVYCPIDDFSEAVWQAAREYFENLDELDALLPGGRYSCAQALVQRNLPFLSGFSLGKVCHMVQLAISQHKILGYCNGAVVPYSRSQSKVKEDCASFQQPCSNSLEITATTGDSQKLSLASWEAARQCLREILENAATPGEGPSMVPLSNVKRLFRSRYQMELSETSLGHSKLSELLQDRRFGDICEVQLQGQGYIVVQVEPKEDAMRTAGGSPISLADSLPFPGLGGAAIDALLAQEDEPRRLEFCVDEPLCLEDALMPEVRSGEPSPLPMPTPLASPGAPTPNTVSRWPVYALWPSAAAKDGYGFEGHQNMPHAQVSAPWNWPSLPLTGPDVVATEEAGACGSTDSTADSARSAPGNSSGGSCAPQSPVPSGGERATLEPQSPAPDDPPMKVFLEEVDCNILHFQSDFEGLDHGDDDEPRVSRQLFCPDEPLVFEDADMFDGPPGLGGKDVKNTFIQTAVTPLVTPQPGDLKRSRSVPKEVGFGGSEAAHFASDEANIPSVVATPAFLPPPTPSYYEDSAPELDALSRVIRIADLI